MDIVDRLKSDHQTLRSFLSVMTGEKSSDAARRRSLSHFDDLYHAHTVAEEMVVYNALEGRMPHWEDLSHVGHTEHNVATQMILRLHENKNTEGDNWREDAQLLSEIVIKHMDDEEREMLTAAEEFFDAAVRSSMVGRYDNAKKIALAERP